MIRKTKKISKEVAASLDKLCRKGMTVKDAAKKLKSPYAQALARSKGFDSAAEYQNDLVKRRYGLTYTKYRRLKELEKGYRQEVLGLEKNLNFVGYLITKLKEEKGTLAIKFSKKEGLDEEDVKRDFKEHLREYSQAIGAESVEEFKVSYRKNTVFIKVRNLNDLESRARLSAYGFSLRREVVRRI